MSQGTNTKYANNQNSMPYRAIIVDNFHVFQMQIKDTIGSKQESIW